MTLTIYALGDSIMWGEGVAEEYKFANRVGRSLGKIWQQRPAVHLLAHCGAKINADSPERIAFANRFPHLFPDRQALDAFLEPRSTGTNEIPAEHPLLHGEVPRSFPTILHQIRRVPREAGAEADVLLINGGANDVDFENLLLKAVTDGGRDFLPEYDRAIKRAMYDDVLLMLETARTRFPKALIALTGYYSAFSTASDYSLMKNMFLELTDNKFAYEMLGVARIAAPALGLVLLSPFIESLWTSTNDQIDRAINIAETLSEAGEARWLYWMRRAVSEVNANPDFHKIRGPGITFAAPGFRPTNCMFAGNSYIWDQYTESTLKDDMRKDRASASPRNALLDELNMVLLAISIGRPAFSGALAVKLVALANSLDGPVDLREELVHCAEAHHITSKCIQLLRAEVDRISSTRVASLIHPNRLGTAQYSKVLVERILTARKMSLRATFADILPKRQADGISPGFSVATALRPLNLDPSRGLRSALSHSRPDVVSLHVRTHETSGYLTADAVLDLGPEFDGVVPVRG